MTLRVGRCRGLRGEVIENPGLTDRFRRNAHTGTRRQWKQFVVERTPLLWLALTEVMRRQFVAQGAPSQQVTVKANSVEEGRPQACPRRGVFWGGRLSPEKGIVPFLRVWPADGPVLTVAGSGPLEGEIRAATRDNIRFVGRLTRQEMRAALRGAAVVAMPSVSPEPLPLVALEAFAEGTPVVSFAGWSLGAVVSELSERCVLPQHDFAGLARRAAELCAAPDWEQLSDAAVGLWSRRYSHPVNVASLGRIYAAALELKRGELAMHELPAALAPTEAA